MGYSLTCPIDHKISETQSQNRIYNCLSVIVSSEKMHGEVFVSSTQWQHSHSPDRVRVHVLYRSSYNRDGTSYNLAAVGYRWSV